MVILMQLKIALITEDTYSPDFIRILIKREDFPINNHKINVCKGEHTRGGIVKPCWDKIRRVLSKDLFEKCDRVIIFVDADGYDRNEIKMRVIDHIKNSKWLGPQVEKYISDKKLSIIVFSEEIEEWIVPGTPKPSEYLKKTKNYDKRQLPEMANEVNFSKLKSVESFNEFIEAIQ